MDASLLQPFFDWINANPGWALSAIFLIALTESLVIVGLFMPGAVLMFGIGALIANGSVEFWPALAAAVLGAIAGDGISFWLGRHYKNQLAGFWPFSRYPGLFSKGETFFKRHGGKSILFGRFVGPVRPVIPATAGMLGMSVGLFITINVLSALLWAPAYLLPGMIFGATLSIAGEVASRLAALIVMLTALIWFAVWLIHRFYGYAAPRARQMQQALWQWGMRHQRFQSLTGGLTDPNQPELKGLLLIGTLLIIVAGLCLTLAQALSFGGPQSPLDVGTYHMLQSLRTPWGDQLMTIISQLSDTVVNSALFAALMIWLLIRGRRLAAGHWLAAGLFGLFAAWSLKQGLQVPRPTPLYEGFMSYSFPSSHALLTTCLYGFLAVLLTRELSPRWRWPVYGACGAFILSVGFSRLYLGAHWLSDVLGGTLLGLAWVAALGMAYRSHSNDRLTRSALIVIPLVILIGVGGRHIQLHHQEQLERYAYQHQITQLDAQHWLDHGWQAQPPKRIDSRGSEMQPLNIQWAGGLEEIQTALSEAGWQTPPPAGIAQALFWFKPNGSATELPLPPQIHNGRPAALSLIHPEHGMLIRLWPADTSLTPQQTPLWIGYSSRLSVLQLPFLNLPVAREGFDESSALLQTELKHFDIRAVGAASGSQTLLISPANTRP